MSSTRPAKWPLVQKLIRPLQDIIPAGCLATLPNENNGVAQQH